MDLKGKIAVVTGASSGIGADVSQRLVEKGVIVYGIARRTEKLKALESSLGNHFIGVSMDITDESAVRDWVQKTFTTTLPDILINNAGIGLFANIDELSSDDWHKMVNLNLNAVYYFTSAIVPLLKQNKRVCHIVNISSIAGRMGNPKLSGYNATKYALGGFSDALMKELRDDGIKVTCIYPGSTATEFNKNTNGTNHPLMMKSNDIATVLLNILEMPDNFLIDEIVMRPLFTKNKILV